MAVMKKKLSAKMPRVIQMFKKRRRILDFSVAYATTMRLKKIIHCSFVMAGVVLGLT